MVKFKKYSVTGCEPFSGKMLKPNSEDMLLSDSMLNLIVKYYTATHKRYNFHKPADGINQDAITIRVKMNKFERCRIGSEVFGSAMLIRHIKSLYILAKFITDDGKVNRYVSQVQYFFNHTVDLPNGPVEHYLTFVQ